MTFRVGDRVRLIAPFRCSGDREDLDARIDNQLREAFGSLAPVGVVTRMGRRIGRTSR